MKKVLGLDLGTTSIGWALVNEAEHDNEKSEIIKTGVRVNPISTEENSDFEKGKATSLNAERTDKRGARRNLQRYKHRRAHLINVLKQNKIIDINTNLSETGKKSTHTLWQKRAKAAKEQISIEDFARVLLAINKKRGYKSNRKTKDEPDDQAIEGMDIAKILYEKKITPAQYTLILLNQNKKKIPEFYRSDLQNEFDTIWEKQKEYYKDILSDELKSNLEGKNKGQTWKICEEPFEIKGINLKEKGGDLKKKLYELRVKALSEKLDLENLAIILQEINGQINNSSSYLGEISDRSKELYFKQQTIGQYLYGQLEKNPHNQLKNQVFYRQDYIDEFKQIWAIQKKGREHILTEDLKNEIHDLIIFYQRRLKSQKGLISVCELEGKEVDEIIDGKSKKMFIGPKAIPKSSPLFQEFKIWQILNNIKFTHIETLEKYHISELDKELDYRTHMFALLNTKGKLSANEVLKAVIDKPKEWEVNNFKDIEGNSTNQMLFKAYNQIVELSGHEIDKKNELESITQIFNALGVNTEILHFNADLQGNEFEKQPAYQLWHLLYSYEGDNSKTGNEKLIKLLEVKFGFNREYAKILVNITFPDDYGSLSAKAIKKILPYLKAGHEYSEACKLAGYNHSHSVSKEENEKRELLDKLEILPKNSLRNPIVEKILNQMVNVVNALIKEYGKPDEIRIELARELKKSAKERAEMTSNISKTTRLYEEIEKKIKTIYPFTSGVRVTKNDIIKYRLWEELSSIGYKTIYTDTYIPLEKLFTKEFDIEHIIPKALLFDDSFSNKTLAVRDFNRIKSNKTGLDAVTEKYGKESTGYKRYLNNAEKLYKEGKISKAKYNKLLIAGDKIPEGFIERDLRNTQYIAKKAQELLKKVVNAVTPTTGSITDKLREDWQLINVMQELNWDKYNKLGLTDYEINKEGKKIPVIKEWSKRNDHRHHAMDAITVAFTKPSLIQYFNYLNARRDETHKKHSIIYAIEQKETFVNDKNKRIVKPPIPIEQLRMETKKHLESILVSFKAKNKVVTRNINKTKKKTGTNIKIELTPRRQLHNETVYGCSKKYKTKMEIVGVKFDSEMIQKVAKKSHREALLSRLQENDNDPKKAFTGKNAISKKSIFLDEHETEKLPEKVKIVWLEKRFTIRKEITPGNFETAKNIEKVIDVKIRKKLLDRLQDNNGDAKNAFSNLEENPIWLNEKKGIKLKTVSISGVSNAIPLHTKKDHFGNEILDENGKSIPVDYISTGNNHHVAIYRDENGNLQEEVVSFFEAVARINANTPVIWHKHPEHPDWVFQFSMKQNEIFVFPNEKTGFMPSEIDLLDENNYSSISPNLFRVISIGEKDYWFRHHLDANSDKKSLAFDLLYKRKRNPESIKKIIKVRINHIGKIVKVGEY